MNDTTVISQNSGTSVIESGSDEYSIISTTSPNIVYVPKNTTSVVVSYCGGGANQIGPAEDGSYADGLFTDFINTTLIGVAVDRFNEVLKALAPAPAPNLSSMSFPTALTAKLSFGPSNSIAGYTNHPTKDINDLYNTSSPQRGVFGTTGTLTGTLADNITPGYLNERPYPDNSFGDGDMGSLHLEINGTIVNTVDLTAFGSGGSFDVNGSGFTLSAAEAVKFDDGTQLDAFKYRTGSITIKQASLRLGYNTVRVRHEYSSGSYRDTQIYEFIRDDAGGVTTFSGESLINLSMAGSKYLSGVNYYTSGTALYNITISNVYRDTYNSGNVVTHSGLNCSAQSEALGLLGPGPGSELSDHVINNKIVTITANRLLNDSISLNSTVTRPHAAPGTSTGKSIDEILMDAVSDNASNINQPMNGESKRVHSGIILTDTNYTDTAPQPWDSTEDLISGDNNHNTGLLMHNGQLTYPKVTYSNVSNGDFSSITNGPANPDYSSATGIREALFFFKSSLSYSNFTLNVSGVNINFVPVSTGPSGNNLTLEILAPNTTQNSSGIIEFKDGVISYSGSDDDIGCYASTYGNTIPTNWGMSLGSRNTSTSGGVIVVRIRANSDWTGYINNISLTWI